MNRVVLRGWHSAIHSALVPKRACRHDGITEERGGETDNMRKRGIIRLTNLLPKTTLKICPPAWQRGICKSADAFAATFFDLGNCAKLVPQRAHALKSVPLKADATASVCPNGDMQLVFSLARINIRRCARIYVCLWEVGGGWGMAECQHVPELTRP